MDFDPVNNPDHNKYGFGCFKNHNPDPEAQKITIQIRNTGKHHIEIAFFLLCLIGGILGGGGHTLALDAADRLHVCGWNHSGQAISSNTFIE